MTLALAFGPVAAQGYASPNDGPFRTSKDAAADRLMWEDHDPVACFTDGAAVPGNPAIQFEHRGVTWRFASQAHRGLFVADPARHMPQFGGFCTNGINYAVPWGGGGGPTPGASTGASSTSSVAGRRATISRWTPSTT